MSHCAAGLNGRLICGTSLFFFCLCISLSRHFCLCLSLRSVCPRGVCLSFSVRGISLWVVLVPSVRVEVSDRKTHIVLTLAEHFFVVEKHRL